LTWSDLHASAFVLKLRPGTAGEYRRRHAALWPEMAAALTAGGIVHYTIWLDEPGLRVFGHMLRDRPPAEGPEDPVVLRWRSYMADVLEMEGDRPARIAIEQVFLLAADQPKEKL
jgi:L-rhamnose mutarotase